MEENTERPIILFEHTDICASGNLVISDLNMSIMPGEFVYIIGKVGSGKTSIIRTIIGENPVTKGNAVVGGFNLRKLKNRQIPYLRRKIGVVFQDFQLLMERSVYDNLRFVLRATGWKDRRNIDDRIRRVLAAVGMEHKADNMPHQLSGGEQQRIAIARALLNSPEIILADEPTGNLDSASSREILQILKELYKGGRTVILITHDNGIAAQAKRVIRILDGRIESDTMNPDVIF